MSRPGFFSATSSNRFSSSGEIDLREWVDEIFYGTNGGTPHAHLALLRRMRRTNGVEESCICKSNSIVREASPACPYCLGEGFYWDEQWVYVYSWHTTSESGLAKKFMSTGAGQVKADSKVFILDYRVDVDHLDKIIDVSLDKDGQPVIPYVRKDIWIPETIIELRSDNGRLEFWAVHCREKDSIREDV